MSTVTLPQGTLQIREVVPERPAAGAPVVVFVHGFLVDGTLWSGVADALGRLGVRSLAPTWPLGSHTLPMQPDADLSPRGQARIIAGLLEALDLDDVTLVGNDTGGALCQFLLDTDPSRIGRVVLTNCDAFECFPPPPFDRLFKLARHSAILHAGLQPTRLTFVRHGPLGYGLLVTHPLDPVQTRAWITPYLTDAGVRRDTSRFLREVSPSDLLDVASRLPQFTRPVLLAWAPADRFFRIDLARRLEQTFPNARLVEIDDARTFVPLDQPQRLAEEIAAFQAPRAPAGGAADATPSPA